MVLREEVVVVAVCAEDAVVDGEGAEDVAGVGDVGSRRMREQIVESGLSLRTASTLSCCGMRGVSAQDGTR